MVRTRLLTDRERRVLEAYLNFKPYDDKDRYFLYVTLHRIRKLKLEEDHEGPRTHKENQRKAMTIGVFQALTSSNQKLH